MNMLYSIVYEVSAVFDLQDVPSKHVAEQILHYTHALALSSVEMTSASLVTKDSNLPDGWNLNCFPICVDYKEKVCSLDNEATISDLLSVPETIVQNGHVYKLAK